MREKTDFELCAEMLNKIDSDIKKTISRGPGNLTYSGFSFKEGWNTIEFKFEWKEKSKPVEFMQIMIDLLIIDLEKTNSQHIIKRVLAFIESK